MNTAGSTVQETLKKWAKAKRKDAAAGIHMDDFDNKYIGINNFANLLFYQIKIKY
jgi:hypothetical protein